MRAQVEDSAVRWRPGDAAKSRHFAMTVAEK